MNLTKRDVIILIIAAILLCLSLVYGKISQVPTPSYHEAYQPRCGLATLSMLAAEVAGIRILPNQWDLPDQDEDSLPDVLTTWTKQTGRIAKKLEKIELNKPYLWVGREGSDFHLAMCYFGTNTVLIKHGVRDQTTRTNFMVVWDYLQFLTNTICIYVP